MSTVLRYTKSLYVTVIPDELHKACEVKCAEGVYAFTFERSGKACASICYVGEERQLSLSVAAHAARCFDDRSGVEYTVTANGECSVINVGSRRFLECECTVEELRSALSKAALA